VKRSASGRAAAPGAAGAARSEADKHWMGMALREAALAARRGEVPVGAVVVRDGLLLGRAGNRSIATHDPAGHAEVRALRAGGRAAKNYRISGATLYVTVEPCAMCVGVAIQARIGRLVYGCPDPKAGAAGSLYDLPRDRRLNHRMEVTAGVAAEASRGLLRGFFRARRAS
jgi:tRNA(adenine34) deaminase